MAFTTILTVVIVIYIIGYTAMIVYDIFLKKDPSDLIKKPDDEDVDIADEAGSFKPIIVSKDDKPVVRPIAEEPIQETEEPAEARDVKSQSENSADTDTGNESDNTEADSKEEDPSDRYKPQPQSFDDEPANRKSLSDTDWQDSGDVDTNATDPEEETEEKTATGHADKAAIEEPQQQNFDHQSPVPPSPSGGIDTEDFKEGTTSTDGKSNNGHADRQSDDSIDQSLPMVRIDMENNRARLIGAVKVEDLVSQVDEFAEKGKDSRLGQLKVIAFAEEEKERIEEMAEAMRLREEARKDGNEQDAPAPPPGLDIGKQ